MILHTYPKLCVAMAVVLILEMTVTFVWGDGYVFLISVRYCLSVSVSVQGVSHSHHLSPCSEWHSTYFHYSPGRGISSLGCSHHQALLLILLTPLHRTAPHCTHTVANYPPSYYYSMIMVIVQRPVFNIIPTCTRTIYIVCMVTPIACNACSM